jgi:pyrroline-5-carboxylate reductase
MKYELGFLGAGNMAEALARAAIEKGVLHARDIVAADPNPARHEVFAKLGVTWSGANSQVIRDARQVVIAVKPQTLPQVAGDLAAEVTAEHVVVSIMAGISTAKLTAAINGKRADAGLPPLALRLVRVMPNTPLMVGLGMAGVALGPQARRGDEALTLRILGSAGKAVMVEESKIDAITAVSGSGPAYVFYLAEAMHQAAVDLGLGEHADQLVRQTILGAAHLLAQSPDTAAELRRKVTSPGGTTEAAIKHLEGNMTTAVVVNAVKAAEKRSRELGA